MSNKLNQDDNRKPTTGVEKPKKQSIFAKAFNAIKDQVTQTIDNIKEDAKALKERVNKAIDNIKHVLTKPKVEKSNDSISKPAPFEKNIPTRENPIPDLETRKPQQQQAQVETKLTAAVQNNDLAIKNLVNQHKQKMTEQKSETMSKTNDSISKPEPINQPENFGKNIPTMDSLISNFEHPNQKMTEQKSERMSKTNNSISKPEPESLGKNIPTLDSLISNLEEPKTKPKEQTNNRAEQNQKTNAKIFEKFGMNKGGKGGGIEM